jgi:heterodisulfide reductase subunit C
MEHNMNPTDALEKVDRAGIAVPAEINRSLASEVMERSGTNLCRCYHCGSCANGCPFIQAMDYPPNMVLRMIQYGMREEALRCKTIWVCVGCHTCSSQCPMDINIASIMEVLRHMAVAEGVSIAKPEILDFHEEVLRSLERHGRAHKLGIMWRYKVQTRRWFSDLDVGLKMLARRKLDLRPSKVQAIEEIAQLFKCYWRESR